MPPGVLTIDGTPRAWMGGSVQGFDRINGRSSLRIGIRSLDGSYVPDDGDDVLFEDSASNVLFGGFVTNPDQQRIKYTDALVTMIDCEDYTALAERRLVNASTTGGITGRDAIDYVVTNYLAVYGVTRDAGMGAGATLGALSYNYAPALDVINDIVKLAAPTGWVWHIDESKVLSAWLPGSGTVPCPWSITPTSSKVAGSDITISRNLQYYANRVILEYGDGTSTPAVATADDAGEQAARGLKEAAIKAAGPFDAATAQDIADAYLARLVRRPKQIVFTTMEPGARAGQTLTVNLPVRSLSGDFLITEVGYSDVQSKHLFYQITAIEGGSLAPTWVDQLSQWSGGSGSGLATIGSITITVPVPAASVFSLGGGTAQSVEPGSGTWLPVVNAVPFVAPESRSVTVRVELWARSGGVTVTARLRDLTTAATAGTSSGITGTTPTLTSFSASVVAGRRYELQVSANAAAEGVYGIGSMEFA